MGILEHILVYSPSISGKPEFLTAINLHFEIRNFAGKVSRILW